MSTFATIAGPSSFVAFGAEFAPALMEKKSAVLKHIARSERLTGVRPASRLEVRPRPEMISSGIPELDALTGGGIPRGCLTEICGSPSSGKTSVLLATLALATQRGESCVLIDARDSFDPGSGASAGMNFRKLLWVRCGKSSSVVGRQSSANSRNSRVPHPTRFSLGGDFADDERRTMDDDGFLNDQRPTADNYKRSRNNHERRLEQVLKSTDLILQSGGFGLVALDLAGIPEKFLRRIPLASWFRFARAVENTKAALLVISEIPCAQTCAALVMKLPTLSFQQLGKPAAISRQPPGKPAHVEVLKELHVAAEILRSRLDRKPMQSASARFKTHAVRAG